MSSPTIPPLAATPSVFLSYASEDRPAVRRLRDALAASGLEVWYDENELTGGDTWDRKIRKQIRECTYFMPIISATTNARAEGYFRREWRMGVERSQDMADDVIYLLPVTIDEIDESTARVPEPFLAVQWLRVPGGEATTALQELCARLVGGGSHQVHKPVSTPKRAAATRATAAQPQASKPVEDLSPPIGKAWWRWLARIWQSLPRSARICIWIVLIISALNTCSQCGADTYPGARQGNATSNSRQQAIEDALKASTPTKSTAKRTKTVDLTILDFVGGDRASTIQQDLFGKLAMTDGLKLGFSALPLKGIPGDATALDRGRAEGARLVLSSAPATLDNGTAVVRVKLERVIDSSILWTGDIASDENLQSASARIYAEILPLVLLKK